MSEAPASALCLIASFLVLLLANPAQASLHPLDLPCVPADTPRFSAADNEIQLSLAPGLRAIAPQESHTTVPPKIDLANAPLPTHIPYLLVGYHAPALNPSGYQNLDVRPSEDLRDEWAFMRRATTGPDALERLGKLFDIEEDERPWSTITTVHVLAPIKGWLVPFAAVAHEADVNDDMSRLGLGAGAMILLGKHASLGAEVVHFGGGGGVANDSFTSETRFLTRLQLQF